MDQTMRSRLSNSNDSPVMKTSKLEKREISMDKEDEINGKKQNKLELWEKLEDNKSNNWVKKQDSLLGNPIGYTPNKIKWYNTVTKEYVNDNSKANLLDTKIPEESIRYIDEISVQQNQPKTKTNTNTKETVDNTKETVDNTKEKDELNEMQYKIDSL